MDSNKTLAAALVMTVAMIAGLSWWTHQNSVPSDSLAVDTAQNKHSQEPRQTGSRASTYHPVNHAKREEAPGNKQDWKTLINREIDRGDSNHDVLNRLFGKWLEEDPMGAIDCVLTSARDQDFPWINGTIAEYLKQEGGFPGKFSIFERLDQEPRISLDLRGSALVAWARENPYAAHEWLTAHPEDRGASLAAEKLGFHHAESENVSDLLGQINLSSMPHQILQPYITELLTRWSSFAPEKAAEWINQNRQAPEIEAAIPGMVANVVAADGPSAMSWAESIRDPHIRQASILATAQVWCQTDPDGYRHWKGQFVTLGSPLVNSLPPENTASGNAVSTPLTTGESIE